MLAGKRDHATLKYRRSLQLDPSNENARSMLAKLQR
jgi:hypothetical protein